MAEPNHTPFPSPDTLDGADGVSARRLFSTPVVVIQTATATG